MPETAAKVAVVMDGKTGGNPVRQERKRAVSSGFARQDHDGRGAVRGARIRRIAPDAAMPVSNHAWRTGGRAIANGDDVARPVRSQVPVEALERGLVVQAANDAAIIIAEGMDGSEQAFAARMNERAKALGMVDSRFVNPTDCPKAARRRRRATSPFLPAHVRSGLPRPIRSLCAAGFEWNKILLRNRNTLLAAKPGATGMAWGSPRRAGTRS